MGKESSKNRFSPVKYGCFSAVTVLLALLIMELLLRICVMPSDRCGGTLFGISLPPISIAPPVDFMTEDPETKKMKLRERLSRSAGKADGRTDRVSTDDQFGVFIEDEFTGYEYLESCTTPGGWWHMNNLGARSWSDTTREKGSGKKRVLVFGDSFTACSDVRQEDSWPLIMQERNANMEVLNFGVDGYGMGQCLLRYLKKRDLVEYDQVILVFVPFCDLERDINTYRRLMGWDSWMLLPRFAAENERLELIRGPYKTSRDFCIDNSGKMSAKAVAHLRKYDALYYRTRYEPAGFPGNLILSKLFLCMYDNGKDNSRHNHLYDPGSEAMTVSRRIFHSMFREAAGQGKTFNLFILPRLDDIREYGRSLPYRKRWDGMARSIAGDGTPCTDLMPELSKMPGDRLDRASDGFHNGRKTNTVIADIISRAVLGGGDAGRPKN